MRLHRIQIGCGVGIECRTRRGATGVVDQNVHRTTIFDELTHAASRRLPVGEVTGDPRMSLLERHRERIADFREGIGVSGQQGHMGAFGSQAFGTGPTDTLGRSADDGSTSF